MGSLTLAYPSIAGKTTQEQLESMRRYLCSVTEQLNLADWSAKATLTEISQAIDADSLSEAEKKTTLSGYGALKALIIKTADFAAANSETWSTKLSGSYVAISDFGKYLEKTQLTIEGNSVGIKQLYDYTAGVNNQFSVNSKQRCYAGLRRGRGQYRDDGDGRRRTGHRPDEERAGDGDTGPGELLAGRAGGRVFKRQEAAFPIRDAGGGGGGAVGEDHGGSRLDLRAVDDLGKQHFPHGQRIWGQR